MHVVLGFHKQHFFLIETLPYWYFGNFFHNRDCTFYRYFFGSCDDYSFVCEFEG